MIASMEREAKGRGSSRGGTQVFRRKIASGATAARAKHRRNGAGSARLVQRQATHDAVLAAARALFVERGIDATSIRDIAAQAGVATGTVLLHGGTKEALAIAAFDDEIDATFRRAAAAAARLPTAAARLDRVLGALLAHFARDRALGRALLAALLFPPPAARRTIRRTAGGTLAARLVPLLDGAAHLPADLGHGDAAELAYALHLSNLLRLLGDDREQLAQARRRLRRWLGAIFRAAPSSRTSGRNRRTNL